MGDSFARSYWCASPSMDTVWLDLQAGASQWEFTQRIEPMKDRKAAAIFNRAMMAHTEAAAAAIAQGKPGLAFDLLRTMKAALKVKQ